MIRALTSLLCLSFACACASSLTHGKTDGVEKLYESALEDLDDSLYPEAVQGFNEVKTKYPYSKYAALADLRIADTSFKKGEFAEAVDGYQSFLKYHPNHAEAAYAMFRIGEAYYEQIPGDWLFLPPSAEKDQANTRRAIAAYRDMMSRYPSAQLAKTAGERIEECRRKLAEHEMYVTRFYFKRDRFRAAALRAEGVLRDYSGLGFDPEALWLAAQCYDSLGDLNATRGALGRLASQYPNSPEASDALRLRRKLGLLDAGQSAPRAEATKGG